MSARERISLIALAAAVGVSVFAIGGAPRWAQALTGALIALAVVPHLMSRRAIQLSPVIVCIGAATLFTLLQVVPLPDALLTILNPVGSALKRDGTALANIETSSALTLDPAGTLRSLAFLLILLAAAVVALRLSVTERGRYLLTATVAAVCALAAIVTGLHVALGATALYGLYEPVDANSNLLGPLLNTNHLGSLMALGTSVNLGLALFERQRSAVRAMWGVFSMACLAVTLASASRGAAVGLVAGLTTVILSVASRRFAAEETTKRRARTFLIGPLPVAILVICVSVLVMASGTLDVGDQLSQTSLQEIHDPRSKFAAWSSAAILVKETPWVGVGRGALESSLTRVHPGSAFFSASHLENEYVQAIVDWGIPAALLLGLCGAWFLTIALRRWRHGALTAGALGGLAAVGLQSFVDFGLELIGLALPTTILAAVLVPPKLDVHTGARLWRARVLGGALILAVLAGTLALLSSRTRTIAEDHIALAGRTATLEDAQASIARHPLDYFSYAKAAEILASQHDDRAVRFLNHAMTLHPTHPGLHRMAARILVRSGRREQAGVEYSAALSATMEPDALLREITTVLPTELAASAIPLDYRKREVILKSLGNLGKTDVAMQWLDRVSTRRPKDLAVVTQLYDLAIRNGAYEQAERAARRRVEATPTRQAKLALAKALFRLGRYKEVTAELDDVDTWQGQVSQIFEAWVLRCDAFRAIQHWDHAAECLHRLESSSLVTNENRGIVSSKLEAIRAARAELP